MKDEDKKEEFKTHSPSMPKSGIVTLTFPDAIREILLGHRVTRLEWNNPDEFACFQNDFLTIHTKGQFHQWLVNSGDLEATDWVVISEGN